MIKQYHFANQQSLNRNSLVYNTKLKLSIYPRAILLPQTHASLQFKICGYFLQEHGTTEVALATQLLGRVVLSTKK